MWHPCTLVYEWTGPETKPPVNKPMRMSLKLLLFKSQHMHTDECSCTVLVVWHTTVYFLKGYTAVCEDLFTGIQLGPHEEVSSAEQTETAWADLLTFEKRCNDNDAAWVRIRLNFYIVSRWCQGKTGLCVQWKTPHVANDLESSPLSQLLALVLWWTEGGVPAKAEGLESDRKLMGVNWLGWGLLTSHWRSCVLLAGCWNDTEKHANSTLSGSTCFHGAHGLALVLSCTVNCGTVY